RSGSCQKCPAAFFCRVLPRESVLQADRAAKRPPAILPGLRSASVGGRLVLWSEVLARCDIAPRQSASSHWSRDASGPFFLEPSTGKIPIAGNRPARAIKPACD